MKNEDSLFNVAMYVIRNCLIVSVQVELHDKVILNIQKDILRKVNEREIKGVIIDVSMVGLMDSFIVKTISNTAEMLSLLGAKTVLIGLKPGIVAAFVDLDLEFKGAKFALNVEEGLSLLKCTSLHEI